MVFAFSWEKVHPRSYFYYIEELLLQIPGVMSIGSKKRRQQLLKNKTNLRVVKTKITKNQHPGTPHIDGALTGSASFHGFSLFSFLVNAFTASKGLSLASLSTPAGSPRGLLTFGPRGAGSQKCENKKKHQTWKHSTTGQQHSAERERKIEVNTATTQGRCICHKVGQVTWHIMSSNFHELA